MGWQWISGTMQHGKEKNRTKRRRVRLEDSPPLVADVLQMKKTTKRRSILDGFRDRFKLIIIVFLIAMVTLLIFGYYWDASKSWEPLPGKGPIKHKSR
jgi:hypothetical protein